MKRISFTKQMRDQVIAGRKTLTTRKPSTKIEAGERFAAVYGTPKRPGFLVPVADAFAICECLSVVLMAPAQMTEDQAKMEGFADKREYLAYWQRLNPTADPDGLQVEGAEALPSRRTTTQRALPSGRRALRLGLSGVRLVQARTRRTGRNYCRHLEWSRHLPSKCDLAALPWLFVVLLQHSRALKKFYKNSSTRPCRILEVPVY